MANRMKSTKDCGFCGVSPGEGEGLRYIYPVPVSEIVRHPDNREGRPACEVCAPVQDKLQIDQGLIEPIRSGTWVPAGVEDGAA